MSQLPGRPDLDQLRRQARELHRAALGGDAGALGRLRQVSGTVALSAAQLAIARDYGFPSWPRLKAEVERRRARAASGAGEDRAGEDRAGEDSAAGAGPEADELIAGQYADRPQLRPVLDAVLAALPAVGPATVQARKTLVSLVTPRRTFAVVQAVTKSRVDLGLRLDYERPGGRLLPARDLGAATVRIPLTRPEDDDAEVLGWLRRAAEAGQVEAVDHDRELPEYRGRAPGGAPGRWRRRVLPVRAPQPAEHLGVDVLGPGQRDPHGGGT